MINNIDNINSCILRATVITEIKNCKIQPLSNIDYQTNHSQAYNKLLNNKFWIDWGDGSKESYLYPINNDSGYYASHDFPTHTYSKLGEYIISIYCDSGSIKPKSQYVLFKYITDSKLKIKNLYLNPTFFNFETKFNYSKILDIYQGWKDTNYIIINPAFESDVWYNRVRPLDIEFIDNNLQIQNLKPFVYYRGQVCPKNNEKYIPAIGENKYFLRNEWLFNSEGQVNALGNKLNGAELNAGLESSSHVYTLSSNKKIDKILCTQGDMIGNHASGFGDAWNWLTFDKSTLTLTIKGYKSGSDGRDTITLICALKFIYTDGTFDTDYFVGSVINAYTCLIENTKVLLKDNIEKNIQDISYKDLIKCYDFFTGKVTYQYPCYIKKQDLINTVLYMTLKNGERIGIAYEHTFYDMNSHLSLLVSVNNYKDLDLKNIKLAYYNKDLKRIEPVGIEKFELVEEQKPYYTIITSGTQTFFSNGLLSSIYQLNFISKTNEKHMLDKNIIIQAKKLAESNGGYEAFCKKYAYVEKPIYYGALLDATYAWDIMKIGTSNKDFKDTKFNNPTDLSTDIKKGIRGFWNQVQEYNKDNNSKNIHTILFRDGNNEIEKEYEEDSIISLPEGEWYSFGDLQNYKDKYLVKMSTILEKLNIKDNDKNE